MSFCHLKWKLGIKWASKNAPQHLKTFCFLPCVTLCHGGYDFPSFTRHENNVERERWIRRLPEKRSQTLAKRVLEQFFLRPSREEALQTAKQTHFQFSEAFFLTHFIYRVSIRDGEKMILSCFQQTFFTTLRCGAKQSPWRCCLGQAQSSVLPTKKNSALSVWSVEYLLLRGQGKTHPHLLS